MGCFDGTCAVTGTALRDGDEVYAVVFDRKFAKDYGSTYEFMGLTARYLRDKPRAEKALAILNSVSGVPDNLRELISDAYATSEMEQLVMWTGYAFYNDYGWAEDGKGNKVGIDQTLPHNAQCDAQRDILDIFMLHADVCRRVAVWMKERFPDFADKPDIACVVEYAMLARIQLFPKAIDNLLGQQFVDRDELNAQLLRAQLLTDMAGRRLEQLEED